MLAGRRNNNENSRKEDEEARQKTAWKRFQSACKVTFATIYLGSIFISGIGWFTKTPGYPLWPWKLMWFVFHKDYPHGVDTKVYLIPKNGKEQEVDMSQWFKYKVAPGINRYSGVQWGTNNMLKLGLFVAKKNNQTPLVEGPLETVKVVYRWWPITRGRRPTKVDQAKGNMQILNVSFSSLPTGSPGLGTGDLKVGDGAPYFELQGSDGKTYRLSDYEGKQAVVIAWFAKAFTGG